MDILKSLGIGQKSPEQMEVENSPVLSALRAGRQPTPLEIEQQKRINRQAGVTYPLFDGPRGVMAGEKLQNINGITYRIPLPSSPINTTGYDLTQDFPVQPPENEMDYNGEYMPPPTGRPAAPPPRRDIVPPAPANMERPQDVLSFRPSPNFPARLPSSTEIPAPVVPEASMPERRQAPIPGPGLLAPPAMDPVVEKPNMDKVLDNLMARYDGLYGQPPVVPEARVPQPQDLGLPAFTTPGYVPEGLMSPKVQQPNMAIQQYTGQLPMPKPTSQLFVDERGNLVDASGKIVQSAAERMAVPDWEIMDIPYGKDAFTDESNFY
jgi:hypothetical protein